MSPFSPAGLSIDPATGVIGGTLTSAADANSPYASTVTVSDGTHDASQSFTWTVDHMALAAPDNRSDPEGVTVQLALTATDVDGDAPTFTATGLPTGLSINATTGVISGTPTPGAHLQSPYQV